MVAERMNAGNFDVTAKEHAHSGRALRSGLRTARPRSAG
jgi:hypothetical protein